MAVVDATRVNTTQFDPSFQGLTDTQALFLRYFLDAENPDTFMRAAPSARAAGLHGPSAGHDMKKRLAPIINAFLEECGLGEDSLRMKLVQLLETNTTKIVTMKGHVEEWELPENTQVVAVSQDGENVNTIVAVRGRAPELQLRALDMALKCKGMYAAEKTEITGKDGEPLELTVTERAARTSAILNAARARRAGQAADGGDA